jgi:hypothetical protein
VVSLIDATLERYLDEVYNKIVQYECKFSNELYEICVLVSKSAIPVLQNYSGITYVDESPFDRSHYIFGNKVVLVDANYIPSFNNYCSVIVPVIVCKTSYGFPVEADIGDYVIYNNRLRQITDICLIDGNRTVTIDDVNIRLDEFFDSIRFEETTDTIRWVSANQINSVVEDWAENPDTSSITEYYNSLVIT